MILYVAALAVTGYFAGMVMIILVGTSCLAGVDASREGFDFDAARLLEWHRALMNFAWRWPLVLPIWLATALGTVVGLVVGRTLRSLRRACRRVLG